MKKILNNKKILISLFAASTIAAIATPLIVLKGEGSSNDSNIMSKADIINSTNGTQIFTSNNKEVRVSITINFIFLKIKITWGDPDAVQEQTTENNQ